MALSVASLSRALAALDTALAVERRLAAAPAVDLALQDTVRAGVIQTFEVAYEQSWKLIQRWLRENGVPEEAEFPRTRKDLFRQAARHGLIDDPVVWFGFGDARNLSSHTYDAQTAATVLAEAARFAGAARSLVRALEPAE